MSPGVAALRKILPEQERPEGSDFLEWVEEIKDGSQSVSVPSVECMKEYPTASLAGSQWSFPSLVPDPTFVTDKDTGIVLAESTNSVIEVDQIATVLGEKCDGDPGNSGVERSPSSNAALMPRAEVAKSCSRELETLQQNEPLCDGRENQVITLTESKEGGDYSVTQEISEQSGLLQVGHEEQTVLKQAGQNTDGVDSLLMKEETVTPTCPTPADSDVEKYEAVVVDIQNCVEVSAVMNEHSQEAVVANKEEPSQAFPEKEEEQSRACPTVSNLSLSWSNLPLIHVAKENNRNSPSEKKCPDQDTSKKPEKELVTEREDQCVDLLASSEPFCAFLLPENQKASTAQEHGAQQADSDGIIKAKHGGENNSTLPDFEKHMPLTKEVSVVDKTLSQGESAIAFTSENMLPEFITKENRAPEENKDIYSGEARSPERPVLTSPVISEWLNSSLGTQLRLDISKRQGSADANGDDDLNCIENRSENSASGKTLIKDFNAECNRKAVEGVSPELSQGLLREKTGTSIREEESSHLSAQVQLLSREEENSWSCNLLNPSLEDIIQFSLPPCKTTEKVCLADAHGSLSLPVRKAEHELQSLNEQTGMAGYAAVGKPNIQMNISHVESNTQHRNTGSEINCVPMLVAEQSSSVDAESNETQQKEYRTEMKNQTSDTAGAQKPASKLDSLQQLQKEQVTEENAHSRTDNDSGNVLLWSSSTGENTSSQQQVKLSFAEVPESSIQQKMDIFIPPLQAELRENPPPLPSICSTQQHISKNAGLRNLDQDRRQIITNLDEHKPNEVEHLVKLNEHTDQQDLSEMKVTVGILHKPQTILCGLETKSNDPTAATEEGAPGSESLGDPMQESNLQTQVDLKEEGNCLKEITSKFKEQDSSGLISDCLHEESGLDGAFAKESVINEKSGSLWGLTGNNDKSNLGVTECIPVTQSTGTTNTVPQILFMDHDITYTDWDGDADAERSRTDFDLLSEQKEYARSRSDTDRKEKLNPVDETILNDKQSKLSFKGGVTFTTDENAGTQDQEYPPLLPEHTEVASGNIFNKADNIPKTEFLPAGSQAELTDLPTSTFSENQNTGISQQFTNFMNDDIVGQLQKNELEVAACQNISRGKPDLQFAATSLHFNDISAGNTTMDPRKPEVLNSDNISSETVAWQESVIPRSDFHSEESSTLTSHDTVETGECEESLSAFSFEKLQTEISTIKMKGAQTNANFKAQQCDRFEESLFSLSSLEEEKHLKHSSLGKQSDCNEDFTTNAACVEDKRSKTVETNNTGNAERRDDISIGNFSFPKKEIDISKPSVEILDKKHDGQISRAFGFGFSDFREHISKIFEKTMPSVPSAKLSHLSAESSAGDRDIPRVKEKAEMKRILEAVNGSHESRGTENSQETDREMLLSGAGILKETNKQKVAPEDDLLLTNTHDSRDYWLPVTCSEKVTLEGYSSSNVQSLPDLPHLDSKVDLFSCSKIKAKESECGSTLSANSPDSLVSLEKEKRQPAISDGPEIGLLSPFPDDKLSALITASSEVSPKSDIGNISTEAAEEENLISMCTAESGLSKEELVHSESSCHIQIPSEDKKNEDCLLKTNITSALSPLLDDLYEHGVQTKPFSVLPGENQKTSTCHNPLAEIVHQDKTCVMPDTLGSTKCLQMSVDAQKQEQGQDLTRHGLTNYLKLEASLDDYSPSDCKAESRSVSKVGVEEAAANDIKLNTAERAACISVDTPKTGITRELPTNVCDLALQSCVCNQGTDGKKHSEIIQGMTQDTCFLSTDTEVASENQCRKDNSSPEKSVQDVQGKGSSTFLSEAKDNLPSVLQNLATEVMPAERYSFKINCQRDLPKCQG